MGCAMLSRPKTGHVNDAEPGVPNQAGAAAVISRDAAVSGGSCAAGTGGGRLPAVGTRLRLTVGGLG